MATIIKSYEIADQAEHKESTEFTKRYWGALKDEKAFLIPFWKVRQMLAVGSSNQIALKVRNINDPRNVSAEYVVFDDSMADTLQDPVERGIHYYVISDNQMDGPIVTKRNVREGMLKATPAPHKNVIWGRLGKSKEGDYFAYFLVAECKIIGLGAGGSSPACGVKIPPRSDA